MEQYNELEVSEQLKEKLEEYKKKLEDKYTRANTPSKKKNISKELVDFSEVYKKVITENNELDWDHDIDVYDNYYQFSCDMIVNFVNSINDNCEFFDELSRKVIETFNNLKYPFYKYTSATALFGPKLDEEAMFMHIYQFLKEFDPDTYINIRNKFLDFELIDAEIDCVGEAFQFHDINKNLILINYYIENNLYKYKALVHECGHIFEMQLSQDSKNNIVGQKMFNSFFLEISSSFFEYAFLNYLKENHIYSDYTMQCFDSYYKGMLNELYMINVFSQDQDLQIDINGETEFTDKKYLEYAEKIKEQLNYYELANLEGEFDFRNPYIYGMGQLISIYLYENYKNNPNFVSEFKKSLLSYPFVTDISVFENVGVSKEILLKGDVLTKVLKKHIEDINK